MLFRDSAAFADGSRYEMIATMVPKREPYAEGLKYRFQDMDRKGRTLLRLDTFPDHPGVGRHHCHTPDGVVDVTYTGLADHVVRFLEMVAALRGEGTG